MWYILVHRSKDEAEDNGSEFSVLIIQTVLVTLSLTFKITDSNLKLNVKKTKPANVWSFEMRTSND